MIKIPDFPKGSYQGGLTKARDGKWFDGSGHDLTLTNQGRHQPNSLGRQPPLPCQQLRERRGKASRSRRRSPSFTTDSTSPTWVPFTKGEALADLGHKERDQP